MNNNAEKDDERGRVRRISLACALECRRRRGRRRSKLRRNFFYFLFRINELTAMTAAATVGKRASERQRQQAAARRRRQRRHCKQWRRRQRQRRRRRRERQMQAAGGHTALAALSFDRRQKDQFSPARNAAAAHAPARARARVRASLVFNERATIRFCVALRCVYSRLTQLDASGERRRAARRPDGDLRSRLAARIQRRPGPTVCES